MQKFKKETTKDRIYLDYFTALNGVLKLTNKELIVLTCMANIIVNHQGKFNKLQRTELCKRLNMSVYNFNNVLNKLVKKSLVAKKDLRYYLNPNLLIDLSKKKHVLSFTFSIK